MSWQRVPFVVASRRRVDNSRLRLPARNHHCFVGLLFQVRIPRKLLDAAPPGLQRMTATTIIIITTTRPKADQRINRSRASVAAARTSPQPAGGIIRKGNGTGTGNATGQTGIVTGNKRWPIATGATMQAEDLGAPPA